MALGLTPIEIVEKGGRPLLAKKEDWKRVEVAKIASVLNGAAFKSSLFNRNGDGMPVIRIRDVGKENTETYYSGEWDEKYVVSEGDLLVGMDGDFRCSFWKGPDALLNQRVCKLIVDETKFDKHLFAYLLQPYLDAIHAETSSVTVKHLSSRSIQQVPLPFPPLPEQKRIVAKIEALFAQLDEGIEKLKAAQTQLKTYRQSVLKAAFEGDYELTTFFKVSEKIQDGTHFSPKNQMSEPGPGRYLYITSKNIRNDYMKLDNVSYVDEEFHNSIYHRCNPSVGDVLLTKDGANTGNVTLNTIDEPFTLLSSVCLIKPKKDLVLSAFIKYYIQSPIGFGKLTGKMSGTAIKRIILRRIKEAEIPLPTIEQQAQIVQEIESRLSVADKMEESITLALQQSETLRQSILKKAFEGRLVEEEKEIG